MGPQHDYATEAYKAFWTWFQQHEQGFFKVLKEEGDIEHQFFHKLSARLDDLRDGYWYLAGMFDDDTAELIFTPDGVVKNIVFVEELVAAAPPIPGWKFTALKPAVGVDDANINLNGHVYNKHKISFYANDDAARPDEINITMVYEDYAAASEEDVVSGVYVFLDNYLGEQSVVSDIDGLRIIGPQDVEKELVPVEKLKDFLIWRQKEFIEKYEGTIYHVDDDQYVAAEGTTSEGYPLTAFVNTRLLQWDRKASHPWILSIAIKYEGDENGLPDEDIDDQLIQIEDALRGSLIESEGFLFIGSETAEHIREIYFACKDFRKPSIVCAIAQEELAEVFELNYEIYKDKYWKTFERYNVI